MRFSGSTALFEAAVFLMCGTGFAGICRASAAPVFSVQGVVRTDILPGSLASVLRQFATTSGAKLEYDSVTVVGMTSSGLRGQYSISGGLSQILAGHGLMAQEIRPGYFVVRKEQPSSSIMLGPVRVAGTALDGAPSTAMIGNLPPTLPGDEVARGGQLGMLGNRDMMDTPFSTSSYTAEFIQNRQIRNVRDALKDDPSVRSAWGTGAVGSDRMQVRGFTFNATDISFSGLYGMLPNNSIMSEMVERVEVLRGPAALLNGMAPGGAVGGAVNVVPKRAHDKPISEIDADYTSNLQFGGHADVGRRLGKKKQLGIRINGVIRSGPTATTHNDMKTALVSSGVDLRLHRVRLSTDFGYQYRELNGLIPYLTLASGSFVPVPDADKVRRNLGQSWSYDRTEDIFGIFKGEVDLFRNITA